MFQYNQFSRIHNKNFDHPTIKLIEHKIIPIFKSSNSMCLFIKIDTTFRVQIIRRKKYTALVILLTLDSLTLYSLNKHSSIKSKLYSPLNINNSARNYLT